MGAIAGIVKEGRADIVKTMMDVLAHRGRAGTVTIEKNGMTLMGSWHSVEGAGRGATTEAVWDGKAIQSLSAESLARETGPFAVAAVVEGGLVLARDSLGVKPLYYGTIEGAFAFASEMKALRVFTDDVREFPAGSLLRQGRDFIPFGVVSDMDELDDEPGVIARELGKKLAASIARSVPGGRTGIWISGGVDSSVIGALAKPLAGPMHSFVSGIQGALDIEYGTMVAKHLDMEHHVITVTPAEITAALPEVIRSLESFDALLVRSSVMNYLASKAASDHVDAVLSGECGDELFAGYSYIKDIPEDGVAAELLDIQGRLHNTALQRVDRCAQSNGIVPLVPFADREVVEYARRIPVKYKILREGGKAIEKWILRMAVEGLIPDEVLWRPKMKFWQGAGVEDLLAQSAAELVSDADFRRERVLENGWVLNSKEELRYYRIFRESFGPMKGLDWMGRTKGAPVEG